MQQTVPFRTPNRRSGVRITLGAPHPQSSIHARLTPPNARRIIQPYFSERRSDMAASSAALPNAHLNPVEKVKQIQSKWCWAACCEAFTRYYKKGIKSQHEFVQLCDNSQQFQASM